MLNPDFLKQMKTILNEENFISFMNSFNALPKKALRTNSNFITETNFLKQIDFTVSKSINLNNVFYINNNIKIGSHPYHHAGVFYVQEPSAMMPVKAIPEEFTLKNKLVLDLCASPGGKSGQLSELVGENGLVISNEIVKNRALILRSNIERMGYKNILITSLETKYLCKNLENMCDLVLVDAPCSGEGMFRKDPDTINEWSLKNIETCSLRQQNIIEDASIALKANGIIIYSTCTYNTKENEEIVLNFLDKHKNYKLIKPNDNILKLTKSGVVPESYKNIKNVDFEYFRRAYPHLNIGEGQFFAIMQKEGATNTEKNNNFSFTKLNKEELSLTNGFFNEIGFSESLDLQKINNYIFALPRHQIHISFPVLTCGVCVGNIEKNRFIPHHNFFKAFHNQIKNKINLKLNDKEVLRFLKGEQIPAPNLKGYTLVSVDNFPLGYGKASNEKLNNLYPKGLRNKQ